MYCHDHPLLCSLLVIAHVPCMLPSEPSLPNANGSSSRPLGLGTSPCALSAPTVPWRQRRAVKEEHPREAAKRYLPSAPPPRAMALRVELGGVFEQLLAPPCSAHSGITRDTMERFSRRPCCRRTCPATRGQHAAAERAPRLWRAGGAPLPRGLLRAARGEGSGEAASGGRVRGLRSCR